MTHEEFKIEWKKHLSRLRIAGRGFVPTQEEQEQYSAQIWEVATDLGMTPQEMQEYFRKMEYSTLVPCGPDLC
jgi:hypothetical protein